MQVHRFSKSPYDIQMELRDGFMPLKCWKCELCDICFEFVELSSLPLPLQEIGIGRWEENSFTDNYLWLPEWLFGNQSFGFLWGNKKTENKYLPSHSLPAQGIYSVYPGGTFCGLSIQGMVIKFESRKVQEGEEPFPLISWIIPCTFRQIQALSASQLSTFQPLHRQTRTSISVSGNKSKDKTLNNYNS